MTLQKLKKSMIVAMATAMTFTAATFAADQKPADPAAKGAQAEQQMKGDRMNGQQMSKARFTDIGELDKLTIKTQDGKKIGSVDKVILSEGSDSVDLLLVSRDGGQTVAAPWTAFTLQQQGGQNALIISEAGLNKQKPMDKQATAQRGDTSQLKGVAVKAQGNQEAGKIERVIFDAESGDITHAVVALDGDRRVRIPWEAVNVNLKDKSASVDAPLRNIHQCAYQKDKEPAFEDRAYNQRVDETFQTDSQRRVHGYVGEEGAQNRTDRDLSEKLEKSAEEIGENVRELYNDAVDGDAAKKQQNQNQNQPAVNE